MQRSGSIENGTKVVGWVQSTPAEALICGTL
jgi:hypothetical protein